MEPVPNRAPKYEVRQTTGGHASSPNAGFGVFYGDSEHAVDHYPYTGSRLSHLDMLTALDLKNYLNDTSGKK